MATNFIATQSKMKALLQRHGFNMKKGFGQNFLIDLNILQKIVTTAGIDEKTIAVEIGPGAGSLTQVLASKAKAVYCFEIDHKLAPLLDETLAEFPNTEVIFADFLKADLGAFYEKLQLAADEYIKIVANLPYYITTPILERVIEWYVAERPQLASATVMMQKEVAKRLSAAPGSKDYGSLSIFIQLFSEPRLDFTVSKNVFIPAPNVDSAIVTLKFKPCEHFATYDAANKFLAFVRMCFATRRKTLANNLKVAFENEAIQQGLESCNLPATIRAEQISLEGFLALYRTFYEV